MFVILLTACSEKAKLDTARFQNVFVGDTKMSLKIQRAARYGFAPSELKNEYGKRVPLTRSPRSDFSLATKKMSGLHLPHRLVHARIL